jgi:hypothetical protein
MKHVVRIFRPLAVVVVAFVLSVSIQPRSSAVRASVAPQPRSSAVRATVAPFEPPVRDWVAGLSGAPSLGFDRPMAQDCSAIQGCSQRCLCYYNSCTGGCGNGDVTCVNSCQKLYNECLKHC